jgi:hypothetical protein
MKKLVYVFKRINGKKTMLFDAQHFGKKKNQKQRR